MLILNVDDDIDDREMFQEAIDVIDPKIECVPFESGIKVLEYLTNAGTRPDFIFIDINMPKMNGYECVDQIRKMPGSDSMAIVMLSTSFNPLQLAKMHDPSIRSVTKTSKFSELVESIKVIVESTELVEKSRK